MRESAGEGERVRGSLRCELLPIGKTNRENSAGIRIDKRIVGQKPVRRVGMNQGQFDWHLD
jgi:hypothetical protein